MKYVIALIAISIVSISCGSDDELRIDSRLETHLASFEAEAAARGVVFDVEAEQIEGYIEVLDNLVGSDVLGFCQEPRQRFPFTSIYIDERFWDNATDLQREYVVYHELGHCFLDRAHVDPVTTDGDGNCLSIMAAGNAPCNGLESYSTERRKELLDELFAN